MLSEKPHSAWIWWHKKGLDLPWYAYSWTLNIQPNSNTSFSIGRFNVQSAAVVVYESCGTCLYYLFYFCDNGFIHSMLLHSFYVTKSLSQCCCKPYSFLAKLQNNFDIFLFVVLTTFNSLQISYIRAIAVHLAQTQLQGVRVKPRSERSRRGHDRIVHQICKASP